MNMYLIMCFDTGSCYKAYGKKVHMGAPSGTWKMHFFNIRLISMHTLWSIIFITHIYKYIIYTEKTKLLLEHFDQEYSKIRKCKSLTPVSCPLSFSRGMSLKGKDLLWLPTRSLSATDALPINLEVNKNHY